MTLNIQTSDTKKYKISIIHKKKEINFSLPDTLIEHLISILQRVNKIA
jgi:hypothetical protein